MIDNAAWHLAALSGSRLGGDKLGLPSVKSKNSVLGRPHLRITFLPFNFVPSNKGPLKLN